MDFNAVPWEDRTLKTHVRYGVRQLWWTALSALLLLRALHIVEVLGGSVEPSNKLQQSRLQ